MVTHSSILEAKLPPSDGHWYVVHTRARREKVLAAALDAARIDHYLPLVTTSAYQGSHRRRFQKPLFASYLFMRGSVDTTYFATSTGHVAGVLIVEDQHRLNHELQQIRHALSSGADLTPHDYFEVGKPVRVRTGPFRDVEGQVEERRSADRLILTITALGRATSLEIDTDLLEPLDHALTRA